MEKWFSVVGILALVLVVGAGCAEVAIGGFGIGSGVETVVQSERMLSTTTLAVSVRTPDTSRLGDPMAPDDLRRFEEKLREAIRRNGVNLDVPNGEVRIEVTLSYWVVPFMYGVSPGWQIAGHISIWERNQLLWRGYLKSTKSYYRSRETLIDYAVEAAVEALKRKIKFPSPAARATPLRE